MAIDLKDQKNTIIGVPSLDAIDVGRLYGVERLWYGGDRHILIFGPNRSGKGTRLLVPNLLRMQGRSIVVIDPKGELAAITALVRQRYGRVVILNPFGVLTSIPGYEDLKSEGYNPLASLDPAAENFGVRASLMADALVPVGGKDPHWDESARAMIATLIMWAALEARGMVKPWTDAGTRFLGDVPTMARIRELLCQASGTVSGKDFGLPALMGEIVGNKDLLPALKNKASQFSEWSGEVRSIASAAKRHTEAFDDPEIVRDMSVSNGFEFDQLKREPVTVYVIIPPGEMLVRHARWLRLIITAALNGVMRPRDPSEPRMLFMMDEFAALGHMSLIESSWGLVAGYGVQFMPVFQDLTQLKALYGERWETFIGNAGIVAAFAPNDLTTAEWLSRRSGETTVITKSYNENDASLNEGEGRVKRGSVGFSPTKVPLLTAHELFGLPPGRILVIAQGVSNIAWAHAPAYWAMPKWDAVARPNPYHHK